MKELDLVIGSLGGCLRGICSNCEYGDSDCHKDELLRDALAYLRELYRLRQDHPAVTHYGYCEDAHEWKYGELRVMGDYWFIAVQEEHGKEFYEVAPHTVNRI